MFVNDNIEVKGSTSISYGLDSAFVRPSYHLGTHNEMKDSDSTYFDRTR